MRKINKKGDLLFPIIIFIVLNIMFFTTMMLFAQRSLSGAMIYEEAYAKQISLFLNRAEPGMQFSIDATDLVNNALENEISRDKLTEIVNIDSEKGLVIVKTKHEGGFENHFFSNIKTTHRITLDNQGENERWRLIISVQ